ncbi:MAG: dihydroorotase [Acidimicrobiia bacterium]|nr:dihydroorotase [Acidimicrobiia bacterium]
MVDLAIRNGSVVTVDGVVHADVAIEEGRVVAIGSSVPDARVTIDAAGAWVGPAFVDLHTHLREPGQEWKEDIESGSHAAAAGGYGAIVAMPNTDPAIDTGALAHFVADRGRRIGLVDVVPAGAITMGRQGATMAHIDDLWAAGVRMFTDDGDMVANAAVLRTAMEYIAALGGVVAQHAVDPSLSAAGFMHEGAVSSRLGMYGIPREADDIAIARDLALVALTGVRYHVQHVSTAGGVDLIRSARGLGLPVTAEVTPHHLAFTHDHVATTDPDYKMMPPLRDPSDRDALTAGLSDGTIDAVATDHAPHAALEKEVPFEDAPNGVIGLEWAASIVNEHLALDVTCFFDRMSTRPAQIAGIPDHGELLHDGSVANIVVFDPARTWTPSTSASRSRNAPYLGMELTGVVDATVLRGVVTHRRRTRDS